jgi:hypothetical protein
MSVASSTAGREVEADVRFRLPGEPGEKESSDEMKRSSSEDAGAARVLPLLFIAEGGARVGSGTGLVRARFTDGNSSTSSDNIASPNPAVPRECGRDVGVAAAGT